MLDIHCDEAPWVRYLGCVGRAGGLLGAADLSRDSPSNCRTQLSSAQVWVSVTPNHTILCNGTSSRGVSVPATITRFQPLQVRSYPGKSDSRHG